MNLWKYEEKKHLESAWRGWTWLEMARVCHGLCQFGPFFSTVLFRNNQFSHRIPPFSIGLIPNKYSPPPPPTSHPLFIPSIGWPSHTRLDLQYFLFQLSALRNFLLYPASPPLPSPSLTFASSSVLISPSLSRSNKANASCRTKWDTALNLPLYSALQAADKRIIIEEEKS